MLWPSIAGIARCGGGLWRYLIARTESRAAIELERERNRATAEALQMLPGDCELLEYEREGRLRVIRRSGRPGVPAGEVLPNRGGELGP